MNEINSPHDLDEKGDILRARAVWLLGYVAFFSWFFFYILYWTFSIEPNGTICAGECIAFAIVAFGFRNSKNYLLIMTTLMICSLLGFFAIACGNATYEGVIYYTPILILVASQLFGKRQALTWMLISLATMSLFFVAVNEIKLLPEELVGIAVMLGVPACIYFCCHQAEVHYEYKTAKLVSFSRELQTKADKLRILATTDSLTSLPNRYQFQNDLTRRIEEGDAKNPFALFLIDMDGFKEINDTMGHGVGDEVLVEIGARLKSNFGSQASIARLGGDEFCVLVDCIDTEATAVEKALEMHSVLSASYFIDDNVFCLGASVGFALYPSHADCSKHLLAFADTAMYHAKHNKLAFSCYETEMTERLLENRALNDRLANAIENDEFSLVYQPQYEIESGRIVGAEALLRWHPDGKLVLPDRFIPLLEQSGRMVQVSSWVLNEACRQQVQWREQGFDIRVAVNISALQFDDPDFVQNVVDAIKQRGVSPQQIDLEITEGLLIKNVPSVVSKLNQIRELGIQISIDDFGTGYSSLAYLRELPIDKLKIDRAFIKDFPEKDDGAIASSIILLGQVLGMRVLAEGVETEEQLNYLKTHNCSELQGYFFSKPKTPDEIYREHRVGRVVDDTAQEPI